MSKFACISFAEDNIIVSKEKSFIKTRSKINAQSISYVGVEGYNVLVDRPFGTCTAKYFEDLERELIFRDVEYIHMDSKIKVSSPFKELTLVTGDEILPLLSYYIMQYIYKYKLIESNGFNTKVGIIAGQVNETIDLIRSIMDEVTDLTLYTDKPLIYKEVIQEIHKKTRLKICAVMPNPIIIQEMNIIFDLDGRRQYALWCNPKAIYIDYKNRVRKYMQQFVAPPPRIWYEFEIVCQRQLFNVPILQLVLQTSGLTQRFLRKEFNHLGLSINRVYTRRIS